MIEILFLTMIAAGIYSSNKEFEIELASDLHPCYNNIIETAELEDKNIL